MRLTTAFNKLLSLPGAWVRRVAFGHDHITIGVVPRRRRHSCPRCHFETSAGYDRRTCRWRHVALGKWAVVVEAELTRVSCPEHGVLLERVAWAAPSSRFTLDFEDLVTWLAREMNLTAVTRLAHVSWRAVSHIVARVVDRKLDKDRLDALFSIGIDEVSYRKGHKYMSVVVSHATGTPVWIGERRSRETIGKFFDALGPDRASRLTLVSMDMCGAFIEEVRSRAPQAIIAFDPFHVVQLANEAVHELRRSEARTHKGTAYAEALKGTRWALLKAPENLTAVEEARLAEVSRINRRVYRGYLLKEELRALYTCSPRSAPHHLDAWLRWAARSRLQPFTRLARTLKGYRDGILAAIYWGVSNSKLEGINNRIGVLKHRAYGFHSAAALIAMVFLCCSKLPVELPI